MGQGRATASAASEPLHAPKRSRTLRIATGCRLLELASPFTLDSEVKDRAAESERRATAIQQKLDRLDEAYLFAQTIDLKSYERQRDKLREELTLAQIDHHAESIEELDVQGILAYAERVVPRAADLSVQASLNQKQRLQPLFLPEGIAFDGNRFNRTAATASLVQVLGAVRRC